MQLNLTIPDLACGACVQAVTQTIHNVDAEAQVTADTKTKQVSRGGDANRRQPAHC